MSEYLRQDEIYAALSGNAALTGDIRVTTVETGISIHRVRRRAGI